MITKTIHNTNLFHDYNIITCPPLRYFRIYNLYSRYDIAHLTLKITLHEFITLVDGNLRYNNSLCYIHT